MSDRELLQRVQHGDREAWRSLYARYLPTVWRFISTKVSDMHAAEDILSETMLAFFSGADKMAADSQIGGWLRTVAHNKVSDYYRQQDRGTRLIRGIAQSQPRTEHFDDDSVATSELREEIAWVLEQLTDQERIALEWKYCDGESVKSIAERLGFTAKATESLLYRGRRAFRAWFEKRQRKHGGSDSNTSRIGTSEDRADRTLKP